MIELPKLDGLTLSFEATGERVGIEWMPAGVSQTWIALPDGRELPITMLVDPDGELMFQVRC